MSNRLTAPANSILSAIPDASDDLLTGLQKLFATVFTYGGKAITTNRLKGSGTEPLNAGWGLNPSALTAANTDTALFDPAPESRVAGTSTQQTTNSSFPNDTYQVVATIQASSGRVIQEFGLSDTTTAAPQTTLSGAISSSGATSITVTSASGFPNSGTYYIQIDNEVLGVTGGQGTTTWTVTRGQRGSTAATHSNSVNVVGGETCSGGNMFLHADFAAINLNNGDSIQFTAKVQFT